MAKSIEPEVKDWFAQAQKNQSAIVRLPYGLGCGLAGGDWDTVLDIISDAAKAWNLNVEIWKL